MYLQPTKDRSVALEMSSGDYVDAAPAIKRQVYGHYLISTLQVAAYATTFFWN